jgi:hypothetical protein
MLNKRLRLITHLVLILVSVLTIFCCFGSPLEKIAVAFFAAGNVAFIIAVIKKKTG